MAKLTIIVCEKSEQLLDGHNLTGYTTDVRFEPEGEHDEDSPLKVLVEPIYQAIGYLMSAYHGSAPCVSRDLEPNESCSLEEQMAKEMADFKEPFPSEL